MEATTPAKINGPAPEPRPQEQLSSLFGSYKAEWLRERMFELFAEPAYFPELTTARPCLLLGGRGTGKTTVLRCLSYEGQFVLRGKDAATIATAPYYGLYYRVNTNRVTAFKGPELPPERWVRVFAHYMNLILCDLTVRFLEWYQIHNPDAPQLTPDDCTGVAVQLNLPLPVQGIQDLAKAINHAKGRFESYINNVADNEPLSLSLQGAPVDALFEAILKLGHFGGKNFFFLLDEYENFEDYQQQVVNTLIKHSGQLYSFKVAVKELGWRRRTTLNENEQLQSPADYVKINIAEKLEGERFRNFALNVCNDRIRRLHVSDQKLIQDIELALPGLTEEEEAEVLDKDGSGLAAAAKENLRKLVDPAHLDRVEKLSLLEAYLINFWAESRGDSLQATWSDYIAAPGAWKERYQNYKHSLLYTLRRRKRGIQKYYCGWNVFTQLAAGNIRYLLELVDQSFLLHLQRDGQLTDPVPPKTQTLAAQGVGKKNLSELEGLSVHGAQLTKLLLGLGRVFQMMATDVAGHAPEVNQFHLSDEPDDATTDPQAVEALLRSAVMHLALLRAPGNKLADETDTKDYDYMVHPVFSAFFTFSYRRKRKMTLSGAQLLGLISSPKKTIQEILAANNRKMDEEPLPEQLLLFEGYYNAGA